MKSLSPIRVPQGSPAADTAIVWGDVRRFARDRVGVVLPEDQSYIVETRIEPLCRAHGYRSVRQLVRAAIDQTAEPSCVESLVEAVTTHETSFFRDPRFWDALASQCFERFAEARRPLRVWSAACSRGQEVFTAAVLIAEHFPHLLATAELYASDVSRTSVDAARQGIVSAFEARRGLPTALLARFFDEVPDGHRLRPALMSRMTFFQHNLVGESPYPRSFDLVLCRNVLIYMSDADKNRIVRRLVEVTRKDGFIAVGASEMLPGRPLAPGLYAREQVAKALGDPR